MHPILDALWWGSLMVYIVLGSQLEEVKQEIRRDLYWRK